ncbi:MAG: transglycosylase domain-containing protein [Proteobacteria bacterium]|nr:transglycosylase domain-containing protein [Pseudomonadota bacterium]
MGMILKLIKYCCILFVVFFVLAAAMGAGGLYYLVAMVPAPEIEESAISEILGRESPVYYQNGQDRLGVMFEGIHRQYLTYDEIPKHFVDALLAAEDSQFFSHFGIDVPGIARAMLVNLKAGKVVQGGSTITQQTAKNLFKREARNLQAKLKELLYALRLEHRYSKKKIFEFYANQFFVSGNGHGLGVAARYFFDKEPKDLTLLECAFIAGSVKRPNYYNPFLRKNLVNADEVRQRNEERVRYVFGQMRKNGMISEAEYNSLNIDNLVFKQGRMSYTQSTAMDLVREGLSTPFIADVLEQNGIGNIATSGARIITTLDAEIQRKTIFGLRRHLSQLDVRLRGYDRATAQAEYKAMEYQGDEELVPGNFVFGTISGVEEAHGAEVRVHFDDGRFTGIIDAAGLSRLADTYARFSRGAQTASPADRKALLRQLQAGDRVYVSIREQGARGVMLLDLERYPQVEGAAFVLQDGAIRALSGGMSNLNFNRATTARRLMGSTFKIFLFSAALQLGWSPVDMLNNTRDTFFLMNRPYTPQPDHQSPFSKVSLSWAGVTSENVAAVWLLYHLTDHLTPPMVRELAAKVDMAPRIDENGRTEDYQHYRERMRDRFGLSLTRQHLDYAAFGKAVRALQPDFVFEHRDEEYRLLTRMRYDDFQQLRPLVSAMTAYRQALGGSMPSFVPDGAGRLVRDGDGRFIFTLRPDLPADWVVQDAQEVIERLLPLEAGQRNAFWMEQVLLDGTVSAAAVQQVDMQLETERGKLNPDKLYTLEVLGEIGDFRVLLGLHYLVRLAKEYGINSAFEPVPSLPLGSNVVSLSELTRMYETIITGSRHDAADAPTLAQSELDGRVDPDGAAIIDRIETPDGQVVYSRQVHTTRVVDPKSSAAIGNILQNVIPYGTGRYAADHVRLRSDNPERSKILTKLNQRYPLLGKTGTANDYRNSAFVGYVPILAPDQSGLSLKGGYTVGVYAGYDNNASMSQRGFRVTGAVGALPAWSAIAQAILDTEKIADRLDPVDLTFNGLSLQYPDVQQVFMPVAPQQGGAMTGGAGLRQTTPPGQPASLCFGAVGSGGGFEPERLFMPYWKNR